MTTREITLAELLESRDRRQALQKEMLVKNPDLTLLVFTVVTPGSIKRNGQTVVVAQAATEALDKAFHGIIVKQFVRDLPTGFEGWYLLDISADKAKKISVEIEDNHPLGRLMDIDIIAHNGIPVSRASAGKQPRKCLLCDNDARVCMRMHQHSYEDIQERIATMIREYVAGI